MPEQRVLVVYATNEGHSGAVAQRIAEVIRRSVGTVDVSSAAVAPPPSNYDVVVAGGPIHAGHHNRQLVRYLQDFREELRGKPTALFQVSLTSATADAAHEARAHALVDELERDTGLEPAIVGLFAGAVVYTRYGWLKRHVMHAIVRHEGVETDMSRDYDYTDWDSVEQFAQHVAALAASTTNAGGTT